MKFRIANEIAQKFPRVSIGIVVSRGIVVRAEDERVNRLRMETERAATGGNVTVESLGGHASVAAWRDIFRAFGAKPSDYRSSVEALLRRTLRGQSIPHINVVVDLYNTTSLKFVVPVGGYDLDRIVGDITLRLASGLESFTPLGSDMVESPRTGEAVYSDEEKVICRRWNYRDCNQTKITLDTSNAVFFVDGAPGFVKTVEEAVSFLQQEIESVCGGTSTSTVVQPSAGNYEWEF